MLELTQQELVSEVIRWNQLRYKREYNHELTYNLLTEEANEYLAADLINDKLDAIGDITFVGIGALWKFGLDNADILQVLRITTLCSPSKRETQLNKLIEHNEEYSLDILHVKTIFDKLCFAYDALVSLDMQRYYWNILSAIVFSNDSKEVPVDPLPSNVKANKDKGPNYESPKSLLSYIIFQHCRRNADGYYVNTEACIPMTARVNNE